MIGKISLGSGFAGAARYDMEKEGGELLETNCAGREPGAIAQEMRAVAASNSACKKPVYHASLSAADGERLSNQQWQKVAHDYMHGMGIDPAKHQFSVTRHHDAGHDHIHILVNRIPMDGSKALPMWKNFERQESALREIEKTHGLKQLEPGQQQSQKGQVAELRQALGSAVANSNNFKEYATHLEKSGIHIKQAGGGLLYQVKSTNRLWKASAVGKEFTRPGLAARGIEVPREQKPAPKIKFTPATIKGHAPGAGLARRIESQLKKAEAQRRREKAEQAAWLSEREREARKFNQEEEEEDE